MTLSPHGESSTIATFQQANGHYPAIPTATSTTAATTTTTTPTTGYDSALYNVCNALKEKLEAFLAEEPETTQLRNVQARLRVSMALTEESLRKYRYGEPRQHDNDPDTTHIMLTYPSVGSTRLRYHGMEAKTVSDDEALPGSDWPPWETPPACFGIDLTFESLGLVMLVIILAAIARCYPHPGSSSASSAPFPAKLPAVYIVSAHPFPQVDEFVEKYSTEYCLETSRFMLSMKEGLGAFLQENKNIDAVFVGTRRTDPFGEKLKAFDPTDSGWPPVMRLHSILDWRLGM